MAQRCAVWYHEVETETLRMTYLTDHREQGNSLSPHSTSEAINDGRPFHVLVREPGKPVLRTRRRGIGAGDPHGSLTRNRITWG